MRGGLGPAPTVDFCIGGERPSALRPLGMSRALESMAALLVAVDRVAKGRPVNPAHVAPVVQLHILIQDGAVQEAALAALAPCAGLMAHLSGNLPTSGLGFCDSVETRQILVVRGLLLGLHTHLLSVDALVSRGGGCVRAAAALCRSAHESAMWLDLVLDAPVAASHYFDWNRIHALERYNRLELARIASVRARESAAPIVEIGGLRDIEAAERAHGQISKAIAALKAALAEGSSRRCPYPPSVREVLRLQGVQNVEARDHWDHAIHYPACRILHAADALDYVEWEDNGSERFGGDLGAPGTSVWTVIAATMLHLLMVLGPVMTRAVEAADPNTDPEDDPLLEARVEAMAFRGLGIYLGELLGRPPPDSASSVT